MFAKPVIYLSIVLFLTGSVVSAQNARPVVIDHTNIAGAVPMWAIPVYGDAGTDYRYNPALPNPPTPRGGSSSRAPEPQLPIFSADDRYVAYLHPNSSLLWMFDLLNQTGRSFIVGQARIAIDEQWTKIYVNSAVSGQESFAGIWNLPDLIATFVEQDLSRLAVSDTCSFRLNVSSTTLRETPSFDAATVSYGYEEQHFAVQTMSLRGGWLQVRIENAIGWVNEQVGTLEGDCATIPVWLHPDNAVLEIDQWFGTPTGFSADGRTLFFGSSDYRREMNTATGAWASQRTYSYNPLLTSSNGTRGIRNLNNGLLQVVSLPDGAVIQTLNYGANRVWDTKFSADGRYLLVSMVEMRPGTSLGSAAVLDVTLSNGNFIVGQDDPGYLYIPAESVSDARYDFLPGGEHRVMQTTRLSYTTGVTIWDIPSRQVHFRYEARSAEFQLAQHDPDLLIASAPTGVSDWRVQIFDLQNGVQTAETVLPDKPTLTAGGHWLWTKSLDNTIHIWGVPEGAVIPTFIAPPTITPTYTPTPTATITPLPPGVLPTPTLTNIPMSLTYTDPYSQSFITLTPTSNITATPTPSPIPPRPTQPITPPEGVPPITVANFEDAVPLITFSLNPSQDYRIGTIWTLTPDGHHLLTVNQAITLHDLLTGSIIYSVPLLGQNERLKSAVLSDDGILLLIVKHAEMLQTWDVVTGTLLREQDIESWNYDPSYRLSMLISPDNRRVLFESYSYTDRRREYHVRDLETGVLEFSQYASNEADAKFLPDGTPLIWNASRSVNQPGYTYQVSETLTANAHATRIVGHVGGSVNLTLYDKTLDSERGHLLQGHTSPIKSVYFSPDDTFFVSVDQTNEVLLWDTITGERLDTVPEGVIPNGMSIGDARWLFRADEGQPVIWIVGSLAVIPSNPYWTSVQMSADNTTAVMYTGSSFITLVGIPTEERPRFGSIVARVIPSLISVRSQPSVGAEEIGRASGYIVVSGRDGTIRMLCAPELGGWVNADPFYVDLGTIPLEDLAVRETCP